MKHEGSSFLSGCAASEEILFFAKEVDSLIEAGTPNCSFFVMNGSKWIKYDAAAAWPAISMTTIKPGGGLRTVVAVGAKGQCWEVEPKTLKKWMGIIDEAEYPVRRVNAVGDDIYLCGMGRLVLRRKGVGSWVDVGPKAQLPSDQVIGFEDIAGFSDAEIYAVGWQGEIWWRDKGRWRRIDSPVSANLNALTCAPDGKAYVVGDGGIMVRGRRDKWDVMETGRGENLMDIAWHDGQVYVVTDFRILRLQGEKLLNDESFSDEDDRPVTCLHLLEAEGAIFSMGPKDLFRRQAAGWERLA